ncbi:MAG: hypothetical protein D6725_15300 [Planctomycetota bacterium]|nr:MAG: hypothetical protein D6725_15300 [Planctomycetota bacterium]
MKGTLGLALSVALGTVAAFANWMYLQQQAENYTRVAFVGIKPGVRIRIGERFRPEHLTKVEIPKNALGNLELIAVHWEEHPAIPAFTATREFTGGELLLQQDLRTPAAQDLNRMLGENEVAMFLPIDARFFNPRLVNPGDLVSFRIPPAQPNAKPEIIGPFRILALGNRKGRAEIQRAAGLPSGAENVIAISVKTTDGGTQLEPRAERIATILQATNFRGVQLLLHPARR